MTTIPRLRTSNSCRNRVASVSGVDMPEKNSDACVTTNAAEPPPIASEGTPGREDDVQKDAESLDVNSETNPLIVRESVDGDQREAAPKQGALAVGDPVDIWTMEYFGYLPQYFVVGIIYGGLPATTYGFFLGCNNSKSLNPC